MSDEPLPLGTVTPEQIEAAKERARALDLEAIEARHARFEVLPASARDFPDSSRQAIHEDRGALLAALRDEREQLTVRLCRLIGTARDGVVRAWLDEDGRVCVLPRAYEKHITVDIGFAARRGEE